jgi:hypothetical protein
MIDSNKPRDTDSIGLAAKELRTFKKDILAEFAAALDAEFPIGFVYEQHHNTQPPTELFNYEGFYWVELDYGGAFFRAAGGLAQNFEDQTTPQADATAVKNLSIVANGQHEHVYYRATLASSDYLFFPYGVMTYFQNLYTSTNGAHTHSLTGGDAETRPKNYTMRLWERVDYLTWLQVTGG